MKESLRPILATASIVAALAAVVWLADPSPGRAADDGTESSGERRSADAGSDAPMQGPEPVETDPPSVGKLPRACIPYLKDYLASASRKLFRALSNEDFSLERVELSSPNTFAVRQHTGESVDVTFEVLFEKNRHVAALVDRDGQFRRTFVVANTSVGPLVVSFLWPQNREAKGDSNCRPLTSRIDFPLVPMSPIDLEPFKFWGLRVLWRLPHTFEREAAAADRGVRETLREVLSLERTGGVLTP